ncbi:hypothetical protein [Ottowia testudinis]|uniref:Uncharacterized protein n=1 Tax=Ottowia testudinis TaxID=2816950 RepID=A0A975CFE9_9BURK|nr:hypothetical protein [Ottowia testudinis]QTD45410.1 hypothetical protein J1M35_00310 [Ottowia testudinis]
MSAAALGVVTPIAPIAGAWLLQALGGRAVMAAMGVYGAALGLALLPRHVPSPQGRLQAA